MADQVFFEDVQQGTELPTLRKDPTTQQLVMYAGASGDYHQIHYDLGFATANGLPNVILHGALKNAFLGQLVTDWIGEEGCLKKLNARDSGVHLGHLEFTLEVRNGTEPFDDEVGTHLGGQVHHQPVKHRGPHVGEVFEALVDQDHPLLEVEQAATLRGVDEGRHHHLLTERQSTD